MPRGGPGRLNRYGGSMVRSPAGWGEWLSLRVVRCLPSRAEERRHDDAARAGIVQPLTNSAGQQHRRSATGCDLRPVELRRSHLPLVSQMSIASCVLERAGR